jgi:hypothetical protein
MTDGAGNGGTPSTYWTIEGGTGPLIADGGTRFVIGGRIGYANARLIRYSPELLEAAANSQRRLRELLVRFDPKLVSQRAQIEAQIAENDIVLARLLR